MAEPAARMAINPILNCILESCSVSRSVVKSVSDVVKMMPTSSSANGQESQCLSKGKETRPSVCGVGDQVRTYKSMEKIACNTQRKDECTKMVARVGLSRESLCTQ